MKKRGNEGEPTPESPIQDISRKIIDAKSIEELTACFVELQRVGSPEEKAFVGETIVLRAYSLGLERGSRKQKRLIRKPF